MPPVTPGTTDSYRPTGQIDDNLDDVGRRVTDHRLAGENHPQLDADVDPAARQPKGDHNRRLGLGLDPDHFAAEAGVTVAELRDYEETPPDGSFDDEVARRVGAALDRLEAVLPNSETGRN